MSHHSELDATLSGLNGNMLSLSQYHNVINHAARYYTQDPALNLIPMLGEQERILVRGYYNESLQPRIATRQLLDRCHISYRREFE